MDTGKTLVFSDMHFGIHGNSDKYLEICRKTLHWISEICNRDKIDTVIFMGDFFDSRSSIDVKTMNYASEGLYELSISAKKIYMILGNHDIYLRDSTAIHSLSAYKMCNNIEIVDSPKSIGNCILVPWGFCKNGDTTTNVPRGTKYAFMHHDFPKNFFFGTETIGNNRGDTFSGNRFSEFGISENLTNEIISNNGIIFSGHVHNPRKIPIGEKSSIVILGSPYETEYGFKNGKCGIITIEDNVINAEKNPNSKRHVEITTSSFDEQFDSIDFENSFIRLKVDTQESFDTISKIQHKIASKNPFFVFNTVFDFEVCPFTGKRDVSINQTESITNGIVSKIDYICKAIDDADFSEFAFEENGTMTAIDKEIVKELAKKYYEKIGGK